MLADASATLSHPFVLLVVGALVTRYLVPAFTRRWQDHQKELEIKVGLVDQISNATAELLIAVQFAELGAESQEKLDEAYRAWEIAGATIGGRLQAYFPRSKVLGEWRDLKDGVTQLYAAAGVEEAAARKRKLAQIAGATDIDDRPATELWQAARQSLAGANDELNNRILNERIKAFNPPLLPVRLR